MILDESFCFSPIETPLSIDSPEQITEKILNYLHRSQEGGEAIETTTD
jgi:hypothetical protein